MIRFQSAMVRRLFTFILSSLDSLFKNFSRSVPYATQINTELTVGCFAADLPRKFDEG
jgi:hypothetical protein